MKKYKIFTISFVAFAVLSCVLYISLVYAQIGYPTESSRWTYECVEIKKDIARKINEPKLLIVSGSGGFWGISAQQIENAIGVKTVNMAVHAGLGIEYTLEDADSVIKNGDVVLLVFEYFNSNSLGETAIDYILSRNPNYFYNLPLTRKIEIVIKTPLTRLFDGLMSMVRPPKKNLQGYQSETTNAWGDQTNNKSSDMTETQRKRAALLPPTDALIAPLDENSKVWEVIESFISVAKQNGVLVLATWPNIIYNPIYEKEQGMKNIEIRTKFFQNNNVPILGSAREFMYPPELFHDTVYHMNDIGAKIRTEKLIEYLKPYLEALSADIAP